MNTYSYNEGKEIYVNEGGLYITLLPCHLLYNKYITSFN